MRVISLIDTVVYGWGDLRWKSTAFIIKTINITQPVGAPALPPSAALNLVHPSASIDVYYNLTSTKNRVSSGVIYKRGGWLSGDVTIVTGGQVNFW